MTRLQHYTSASIAGSYRGGMDWQPALRKFSEQKFGNVYADLYAEKLYSAIEENTEIADKLDSVTLGTALESLDGATDLRLQFHWVAKLIKASQERRSERDFFFLEKGGWDTHTNQVEGLEKLFEEVNGA